MFKQAIEAFAAARERHARARIIQTLDERTLRDIGLEAEANRVRDQARHGFMRFGMY